MLVLACFLALVLSGCADGPAEPTVAEFDGADHHFTHTQSDPVARFQKTESFVVPNGTADLRIAVAYDLGSGGGLKAAVHRGSDGAEIASLENHGPVQERDARWFLFRNVTAGPWHIGATLTGEGSFTFGVFFEGRTTPHP